MKRRQFFTSMAGITVGSGSFLVFPPGLVDGGKVDNFQVRSATTESLSLPAFKKAFARVLKKTGNEGVWRWLRRQFCLPKDYIYLNTGGLGSSPYLVINEVIRKIRAEETSPEASHNLNDWDGIKEQCARIFGPSVKKEELAFTSSATEGINIILNGLPLHEGDEIITSTHEHVALNVPLLYKMNTHGIIIKTFEPDLVSGKGNVKRIEKCITPRTRLIFTSHITCTTGQVMPLKEIGELARARGLWFALDGVQAPGQVPIDLTGIGVDFYAISGHKWLLGPKRTGVLYVREEMLNLLQPSCLGAYSSESYDMDKKQLQLFPSARRYEYGTQNEALFYGLGEALDFIQCIGIDRIYQQNKRLVEKFYRALLEIPGVEILSPVKERYRSCMITFKIKNKRSDQVCGHLKERRIRVRHVTEAGLDGVRVSFHLYNNEKEVDRLLVEIKKTIGKDNSTKG